MRYLPAPARIEASVIAVFNFDGSLYQYLGAKLFLLPEILLFTV